MPETLTSAISDVVSICTTNVLPVLTSSPMVYFFAASLFGLGCGVFAKVRGII